MTARATEEIDRKHTIRAGLAGGLAGGAIIWIYEAVVWVGVQHSMPLAGIPRNATGLVFGKAVQESLGGLAYLVGTGFIFYSPPRGVSCLPGCGRTCASEAMKQPWWHCSMPSSPGS